MVVGIESEGWAERCAGKSPSETAFTTPTRSYGNQCKYERASAALDAAKNGNPSARTTT
jgi:hypothetical protein